MCLSMFLSDGAMCVMQNSLGGGVCDSFKINHKTSLHMSIIRLLGASCLLNSSYYLHNNYL